MDVESVKLGERGQIVIPQDFRKELKLKKGEKILAVLVDDKIVLEQMSRLKAESVDEVRQDITEMGICSEFWDHVKSGKPLIRQRGEEFLQEIERW
jgi:AbrB family looped-hinge helix DNA binding protein